MAMIDRFTEQAKEAVSLAVDVAGQLGHSYVGTEHLLIGLLQEGNGVAARVLSDCGVKPDKVIELVSQLISPNQGVGLAERSTYTPSARRVLENSYREAVPYRDHKRSLGNVSAGNQTQVFRKSKICA